MCAACGIILPPPLYENPRTPRTPVLMRRSVRDTLELAVEHHQAGRLGRAEALYRKVIAIQPNDADASHLLGLVAHQQGHHELAERRVRRAISARGHPVAEFSDTLGKVLAAQGRYDEALACFQESLSLRPDVALTHQSIGTALCALGRASEAAPHFEAALRLSPGDPAAHVNMGTVLLDRGMPAEAMEYFRKALDLDPGCAEAWCNLGRAECSSSEGTRKRRPSCRRRWCWLPASQRRMRVWAAFGIARTGCPKPSPATRPCWLSRTRMFRCTATWAISSKSRCVLPRPSHVMSGPSRFNPTSMRLCGTARWSAFSLAT
jgi:Tfp pilus assembly protein PilF